MLRPSAIVTGDHVDLPEYGIWIVRIQIRIEGRQNTQHVLPRILHAAVNVFGFGCDACEQLLFPLGKTAI
jgi:hypothetical protein